MMVRIVLAVFICAASVNVLGQTCNDAMVRRTPDTRFSIIANGAEVSDSQTGLVWQRCSVGMVLLDGACNGNAQTFKWKMAIQEAQKVSGGWRLPNVKELLSIVEEACVSSSINETLFPSTANASYWTSSMATKISASWAWVVDFDTGGTHQYFKYDSYYLRLVRTSE